MGDPLTLRVWVGRSIYLLLAAVILFGRLLPVNTVPGGLPTPDLLLCVTFAWVVRRPDHVPPILIVAVFLVGDMLFLRPPGLWTLLILAATEFLRAREALARELPYLLEWALISAVLLAATLAEALILTIFIVPATAIGVALLQTLITILAYPAVVAALWLGLGLRRAAPGEVDELGRRL